MARLYADEDFSYPVVVRLRQLGHDILTAQEAGQTNQGIEDETVLAYASEQSRAVLTFNQLISATLFVFTDRLYLIQALLCAPVTMMSQP